MNKGEDKDSDKEQPESRWSPYVIGMCRWVDGDRFGHLTYDFFFFAFFSLKFVMCKNVIVSPIFSFMVRSIICLIAFQITISF